VKGLFCARREKAREKDKILKEKKKGKKKKKEK
jgi:hypothetical protein